MEYNLKTLIDNYDINQLSLVDFSNQINSLGLELEGKKLSKQDFILDLKTPADRQDLKNLEFCINELAQLFQLKKKEKWKKLKGFYENFLIEKINKKSLSHSLVIENFSENFVSPYWIKLFLESNKIKANNDITDFKVFFEFFYKHLIKLDRDKNYQLSFLEKSQTLDKAILEKYQKKVKLLLEFLKKSKKNFIIKKFKLESLLPNKIILLRKKTLLNIIGDNNYSEMVLKKLPLRLIGESPECFSFLIPKHREDLNREIDIIEEYCRFFPYEKMLTKRLQKQPFLTNSKKEKIDQIKTFFILKNYTEILTTSLNEINGQKSLSLINPLNNELKNLQFELSLNHSRVIEKLQNISKKDFFKFFEIARVFQNQDGKIKESDFLQATILLKKDKDLPQDFVTALYEGKKECDSFFNYFHLINNQSFLPEDYKKEQKKIFYKPNQEILAEFFLDESFSLEKHWLFVFRLNLNLWLKIFHYPKIQKIKEKSKYPEIQQDLSFYCTNKELNLLKMKKDILATSKILKKLSFFDIYLDSKIPSLGLRLIFQSYEFTLRKNEVEKELTKIIKKLKSIYNLELK